METKLKQIMADIFDLRFDEINDQTAMQTLSAWDSLKHMALIAAIEENFDIPVLTADEIVSMTNYVEIIRVLQKKITR